MISLSLLFRVKLLTRHVKPHRRFPNLFLTFVFFEGCKRYRPVLRRFSRPFAPGCTSCWHENQLPESWRRSRHTAPRHSYAACHFGNKYEADAPADSAEISDSRFPIPFPTLPGCLPRSRVSRAFSRFEISWKVESYDRYVLEIGKSIFFERLPFSFIRGRRLCINAPEFMAGKRGAMPRFIPALSLSLSPPSGVSIKMYARTPPALNLQERAPSLRSNN